MAEKKVVKRVSTTVGMKAAKMVLKKVELTALMSASLKVELMVVLKA